MALRLTTLGEDVQLHPLVRNLWDSDVEVTITMRTVIVGFPLGLAGPKSFPIWKSGYMASEPGLDFKGQPMFLIDATTRSGMSGSPVFVIPAGPYRRKTGEATVSLDPIKKFMGVYSGRLPLDSNLGEVWKSRVIDEILDNSSPNP